MEIIYATIRANKVFVLAQIVPFIVLSVYLTNKRRFHCFKIKIARETFSKFLHIFCDAKMSQQQLLSMKNS